ncbi:MAG TPA: TlpA disulfide reductase family protein [Verrucomicrobiota bacterium]|nr:TlpA disulfide reductase family protein [Verrucomicrobiota bacterium]
MRLHTIILAGLLAVTLPACAERTLPLLNANGETYTNVTILKVTATEIHFTHSRGMANAKLKDLDPGTQTFFNYDPAKAGDAQKKHKDANARPQQQVQETKPKSSAVKSDSSATKAKAANSVADNDEPVVKVPKLYARSFINKPAPELVVEKWLTPKPNTNGKFVLIDFWATWCGPCRQSIPGLNKLANKHKDRMVVIGLSDETEAEVRAMKSPKIEYSMAIDTQDRMSRAVQVTGIPHALLLDPQGIVRFEGMPHYLTDAALEKIFAKYSN